MTNTTVTDVKNMLSGVAGRAAEVSKTADAGSKKQQDGYSFTKVMSETSGKSTGNVNQTTGAKQSNTVVEKPGRKNLESQNTETEKAPDEVKDDSKIAEAIVEKTDEIKDSIKEELGISEEQLVAAMETLGLTTQDLLNPNCIKDLMLELSGMEDSLSLLTNADLYEGMKEIMQMAENMSNEIKETFSLTDAEFAQILEGRDAKQLLTEGGTFENPETEEMVNGDISVGDKTDIPVEKAGAPVIKVEVMHSEETRTTAPMANEQVTESENDSKGLVLPDNTSKGNADNQFEESNSEMFGQAQQTTTTTTNSVGEVVETVKQFAQSYVNGEEVLHQVTETIKVNMGPDVTSMEMQLHPASLGTVNMQISAQNGIITAQLLVQNEAVKAALETQLVHLQETFEAQGQKVEAIEVTIANYDLDRGLNQSNENNAGEQQTQNDQVRRKQNLNLNDLDADELEELDEEEQLAAAVMTMNGNSVDFTA